MTQDLKAIHPYLPKLAAQLEEGRVSRREFLRTSTLLGLSATAAYALAGLPLSRQIASPARAAEGGVVKFSMRIPALENPHTFSWVYDSNCTRQVVDYLTRTDAVNVTHPWLLEKWEATEDLKTWNLYLKKDIKWSNGETLVADHVVWNMKRWLDPAVGSSVLGLMKGYMMDDAGKQIWEANAIEKVSDYQIRLNCRAAQLAVPEHLFHYPAQILYPPENGKFTKDSVGTGAFKMVEYEVGKKVALNRRDGYWGQRPALDGVEFIDHGDDPAAALQALASKQVHGLYEGSTTQYAALEKMTHVEVVTVNTAQTGVARMQPAHKPWDDARVRKAMKLALDTQKLLQIAHLGLGLPAEHHHVAPVHPEYAKLPFMKQDIPAAKKLLADAGYPNGIDAEIVCKKDPEWEYIAVQAMVNMWKDAGARIKINVLPSAQYWDIWNAPTNPFAFTAWTHRPLGVMVLGLAYRSGVPWNESFWSNKTFDDTLTKAEGILDVDERRKVMVDLEKLMQEEGPIAQPLWRALFTAVDKRVVGFKLHPTNYYFCEEWSLKSA
jgi:peptide/nickel transport system substrate-binding protein